MTKMDKKEALKQIKADNFKLEDACNFNRWETIESITYDNQEIEHYMGDSTNKGHEFQVIKVTK